MVRLHGFVASPVAAARAGRDARVPATFAYGFWWYDVQQVEGAV